MVLVFGLGNPGSAYECSRHNIGFMVVDRLARESRVAFRRTAFRAVAAKSRVGAEDVVLIKPQTYMNLSGIAASAACRWFGVDHNSLLVVYDDMDLDPGRIRIRAGGSAGGHNGMKSIIAHMGTEDIRRVRIGIGRPAATSDPVEHVLGTFDRAELPIMSEAIVLGAQAVRCIIEEGIEVAQTRFNSH
ncbi:MAG: aminoacyl-tRNA hydrolase [Firmicutes bacterium]|jgi:PTH1 family peptidyl-tRNA hydrolase|nr:aminoacyl-tRNA hydrolase [Bacillota bacterium]